MELKKVDKTQLIERVNDVKEFKKLLRTRNNVLTVFANSGEYCRLELYCVTVLSLNTVNFKDSLLPNKY